MLQKTSEDGQNVIKGRDGHVAEGDSDKMVSSQTFFAQAADGCEERAASLARHRAANYDTD